MSFSSIIRSLFYASWVYHGLWFAHPILQLAVLGAMVKNKWQRKFPVFFAYLIFEIAIFPALYYLSTWGYYTAFFYTYWTTAAVSQVIGFKVIHEIFLDVFQPYHTLKDLGTILFKWASLVMLMVAAVIAAASPPQSDGPLVLGVLTLERCVRVMQCGLVMFLLTCSRYLGVSRKQHSFGLAVGFGIFAGTELLMVAFIAAGHRGIGPDLTNMCAYNCAILVWLRYMAVNKQPKQTPENNLVPQRWDQTFMDLQHPMPVDSLIPMFENMVEQAISRVHDDAMIAQGQEPPLEEQTLQERLSASLGQNLEPHGEPESEPPSELANSASASGGTSSKS